jgi:hypothetical protein
VAMAEATISVAENRPRWAGEFTHRSFDGNLGAMCRR